MATFERNAARRLGITGVHMAGLAISTGLGLIAGSSFLWATPDRAWNIFLAGFLWTLLLATATALVRCVREQLQRGDWWNGIALGLEMTFPLTTLYIIGVGIITIGLPADGMEQVGTVMVTTRPNLLVVAPAFYASSLVVAIVVGPVYALTSPFRREQE